MEWEWEGVFLAAALYYGAGSRRAAPLKSQPSDPRARLGSQVYLALHAVFAKFVLVTNTSKSRAFHIIIAVSDFLKYREY